MAEATSQLNRIADLVERTRVIGGKQRGMRIEADEWNTLVEVLLGVLQIDRLQEQGLSAQLEAHFAPREHEHLGEVNIAWLEPGLQSGLSGRDSVSTRQVLADMDRKIVAMQDQLAELQTTLDAHQRQLDRIAVDEIDRSNTLRDFETRFEGVSNVRTVVQGLATEVEGLRSTFDQVLELKKTLTDPQGEAIDVARMRQDVADLQSLRESLNGVDGQPLTLREIEARLAEVADAVGVGSKGALDQRLSDLSADVEAKLIGQTDAKLAESLDAVRAEHAAMESRLGTQIQSKADEIAAAAAANTAAQVLGLQAGLTGTVDERLAAATTSIRESAFEAARLELDQRMAAVPEIARSAAAAAAAAMGQTVTTDLGGRLTAEIGRISNAETVLGTRLASLETAVPAVQERIPVVVSGAVESAAAALESSLTRELSAQMTAFQQQLQTGLTAEVAANVNASLSTLDSQIARQLDAQMPAILLRIDQGVTAATKNLDEGVASEVGRQLASIDVDGRIQRSVQTASQQLESTVAVQLAGQDARLSTVIGDTANLLRGELNAAVENVAARSDLLMLKTVDQRIGAVEDGMKRVIHETVAGEMLGATRVMEELRVRVTRLEGGLR
jgi:hypothetical protein